MTILWTFLVGLLVGAMAKMLMPGRDPGGILPTMAIGVVGAFVAHYAGRALGLYADHGQAPGLIASVLGATLLLGVYRLVTRARATL